MIETFIERAMPTALCRSFEKSFREANLTFTVAQEMYTRLLTPAPVNERRPDAAAAPALDVDDKKDFVQRPAGQSMPSEARMVASI